MKPILFIDFDGTLCHDHFWQSVSPEIFKKIHIFQTDIADLWMRGEYTSEEINKLAAETTGIEYKTLWKVFIQDCKSMKVSLVTLKRIYELRDKFTVILLTDNMDCFDRYTVPSLLLNNYFDFIINSFNEKMTKNDYNGKIFLNLIAKFGADIKDSILIDNSKKTCEIFEILGGKAFWTNSELPVENLLNLIEKVPGNIKS